MVHNRPAGPGDGSRSLQENGRCARVDHTSSQKSKRSVRRYPHQ